MVYAVAMSRKKQQSETDTVAAAEWMAWQKHGLLMMAQQQELMQLLADKMPAFERYGVQQDPMSLQQSVLDYWSAMMSDPEAAVTAQVDLWRRYFTLCEQTVEQFQSKKKDEAVPPRTTDRRFRDQRWFDDPFFSHLRQAHELMSEWLQGQADLVAKKDKRAANKMRFAMRHYADAIAPSNFWMTNPEVLDETIKTQGRNLLKGLQNMTADIKASKTLPKVAMAQNGAFELGCNIATTKGKVVFKTEVMELIQYAPTTETVFETPLLIVAPWINKYYILDMQPENSFVKWATDQGHTVFITSWKNVDEKDAHLDWFSYLEKGLAAALQAVQNITGQHEVNTIGYCIGGTLLTTALAYWRARGDVSPVKSATFFTTLIDFSDSGELSLFTDEPQIAAMEKTMETLGYLDAWHTHTTFNMLRANDLIWSFVVNNYLLGREPFPFDLLFWNSDATRIPQKLHSFYLRQMYMHNNLAKGRLVLNGTKLDVSKTDTPSYFISAIEDHIAPWKATYRSALLPSGDVTFTLSGSGHIAGIVNPPAKNKYGFWTNDKLAKTPEEWLDKAQQNAGSWWPHWQNWIIRFGGKQVPARQLDDKLPPAPGAYVKIQAL